MLVDASRVYFSKCLILITVFVRRDTHLHTSQLHQEYACLRYALKEERIRFLPVGAALIGSSKHDTGCHVYLED